MYLTMIANLLGYLKKYWFIIPVIIIVIYVWYLKSSINRLTRTIDEKEQTIFIMQEELDFQNEKIANQLEQIEALKNQSESIKVIEKHYFNEKETNKVIIEKYKNDKDTKPIMKQIEKLLPGGSNE